MPSDNLTVTIRNRDGIIHQTTAKSISAKNKIGKFDVLKSHANFISIITDGFVIESVDGAKKQFAVDSGVLRVKQNIVDIFLGIKK